MLDWYTAYFKDATWSQLRNNGGLSNIHNQNVVRKVNDYYKWASVINDYKDEIKEQDLTKFLRNVGIVIFITFPVHLDIIREYDILYVSTLYLFI